MRLFKQSIIRRTVKEKLESFLLKEQILHPFLYFVFFFYSHSRLGQQSEKQQQILYLFAIGVALLCNYNFLYALAPYHKTHIAAAAAMFLISIFSCNEKWKAYIFVFSVGDSLFYQAESRQYFLASFSLFIAFETYRTLVFKSVIENVQYFVGMTAVSTYYLISIISCNFGFPVSVETMFILLIATATLASTAIQYRIDTLRNINPSEIRSDSLMAHYLKLVEQGMADPYWTRAKIVFHSRSCEHLHCFCHNQQLNTKNEYFLRQLYENALKGFKDSAGSLLYESYVSFLLKNEQIINALYFLGEWRPSNYIAMMSHLRCKARVEEVLRNENNANRYHYEYSFPIEYDRCSQVVALQINEIIKAKLQFWHQVNRESSKVARIQKLGLDMVDRMYRLNVFYSKTIRKFEKSIFLFDSTALYAMYMLSTTNFKEYAELIIKNTAKLLEDVYVLENSASETYSIRTVVRRESQCFIPSHNDYLIPIKCLSTSRTMLGQNNESKCKLIIDEVSSGFCKVIGMRRRELLGCQLNSIIPDGYKQVHNVRLSNLLDFDSESIKEIVPSKVMHKELNLPIKGVNGKLLKGFVCIKSQVDLKEGLTFVSIIKLARDKSSSVLMNFEGEVTEVEEGFNLDLLSHSQIKRYLSRLKENWRYKQVIPEEKFNLIVNTANYGVTISSPLLGLFLEKENLKEKCPPIHIDVINEEVSRHRTVQGDRNNKIDMQIKHMEKAIYTYDAQSSTNSSKGGNSAVSILSTFSQANTVPLYRFLQLTFLATILCCVLSNIGAFFVTQLPWDSTVEKGNPLNDTMNLYSLQMLTTKALHVLGDQQAYLSGQIKLNKTRISQYFGYADYTASMISLTSKMQDAYVSCIRNSMNPSNILKPTIEEILSKPLHVSNPIEWMSANSAISFQNMTYLDLLMIYATDLSLMTRLSLYNTIITYTYTTQIEQAQNASRLSSVIDNAIHHTQAVSIAVHSVLMVAITLLLIPSCCLLHKRLLLHEKVYDLLVSIDPVQVSAEIQSLQYIGNILRNYKESNDIMKMNVMGYQENLIQPKQRKSFSSADNEMILGLSRYDKANCEPTSPGQSPSLRKDSFLSMVQQSFSKTQMETTAEKRKRSGELDLAGSSLDPQKKVRPSHCALYAISLSFLIILGLSLHYQMKFSSTYIMAKNVLLDSYNNQILFEQYLLLSKLILITGSSSFASYFGYSDALPFITNMMQSFPTYDYQDHLNIYSEIFPSCANSINHSAFAKKYCEYDYSTIILIGQFGSIYKNLLELRYNLDHGTGNLSMGQTVVNINEKLFYLQSLNLQLEEMVMLKVNLIYSQITRLSQAYREHKAMMLMVSAAWGLACCLLGFWLILRMKQRYFKEVLMITFLNNDMITKNKRVESFLQSISKYFSP